MPTALITGSAGLIGSACVRYLAQRDWQVIGVDNNMRQYFFGPDGDTNWVRQQLEQSWPTYRHHVIDIRDEAAMIQLFRQHHFNLIIHAAAQPSHDWAAKEPLTDFSINATATLRLLELTRQSNESAVFIFTSTNKVYGDNPNKLPLLEQATRYEISPDHAYANGIDESMSLDHTTHSVFGASKVAADIMVQEYGRYFGLATGVFRGGCLTGAAHSGAALHGFLSYLVKCITSGQLYTIHGYKGKQVRDNIHADDVASMFYEFYQQPRAGEVYNLGGGRHANVSILEAITSIEKLTGKQAKIALKHTNRIGDHIWYISDTSKFQRHYPNWQYTYDIDTILTQLCATVEQKTTT